MTVDGFSQLLCGKFISGLNTMPEVTKFELKIAYKGYKITGILKLLSYI
jgi:hypothetical protein